MIDEEAEATVAAAVATFAAEYGCWPSISEIVEHLAGAAAIPYLAAARTVLRGVREPNGPVVRVYAEHGYLPDKTSVAQTCRCRCGNRRTYLVLVDECERLQRRPARNVCRYWERLASL